MTEQYIIPQPFDQYYEIISDQEFEELSGTEAKPYLCETVPGYEAKHLAYLKANDDAWDELCDKALELTELIQEGDDVFVGYNVAGRIYPVSAQEMPDNTTYGEYAEAGYVDDDITAAVDTGLEYWYYTRHGLGPGMMPSGVNVIDWFEDDHFNTWFKTDKLLTTEELNQYEIKEECPPTGSKTHNGEVIGATDVEGRSAFDKHLTLDDPDDDENDFEDDFDDIPSFNTSADVVVPAIAQTLNIGEDVASIIYGWYDEEDAWEDFDSVRDFCFFLKTDIYNMLDACDDDIYDHKSDGAIVRDALDANSGYVDGRGSNIESSTVKKVSEDDETIHYVVSSTETSGSNVEGMSIINHGGYKILVDPDTQGWAIFDKDRNRIKGGFLTSKEAEFYIDQNLTRNIQCADKETIQCNINPANIDDEALKEEILEGVREYMLSPEGGWSEDEVDDAMEDYVRVEVRRCSQDSCAIFKIEVRAELSYEGMENLADILDPIVENYDEGAYFDMVAPGIMESYIGNSKFTDLDSSTNIEASRDDLPSWYDSWKTTDPRESDPSYQSEEHEIELDVDIPFSLLVVCDPQVIDTTDESFKEFCNSLKDIEELGSAFNLDVNDDLIYQHVIEEIGQLDELPTEGTYRVSGIASMTFDGPDKGRDSSVLDCNVTTALKDVSIQDSSKSVRASMTEQELDEAIMNGKPFNLEDFTRIKHPIDPEVLLAEDIEVGDVIDVQEDASEVNLGTVLEILAINEPGEDWIDYTFTCKVVEDPGQQSIQVGDTIDIHFDASEPVGYLVPM